MKNVRVLINANEKCVRWTGIAGNILFSMRTIAVPGTVLTPVSPSF